MKDSILEAVAYIDKRLASIERAPGTWGSPESLELQTLLLLELRSVLVRQTTGEEKPFAVRLAYIRFIKQHIKNASAEFLAAQLVRHGRIDELPGLLAEFRDQIIQRQTVEKSKPDKPGHETTLSSIPSSIPDWGVRARKESHGQLAPPRMGSVHAGVGR